MKKLVIIGAKRTAKEAKEFIDRYNLFEVIGFSVNEAYIEDTVFEGLPVFPLERLDEYIDRENDYVFVAASQFNYLSRVKRDLYNYIKEHGYKAANLIAPTALIFSDDIGEGNWIGEYAHIGEHVKLGSNNVIRPFSYIGHYAIIKDHNFIGAKALLGGGVHIEDQTFVGLNATVFNRVAIGNKCIIGAATAIKKNVPDFCVCKLANDTVEVYEYDSDRIEEKLGPMDKHPKRSYDTIKK